MVCMINAPMRGIYSIVNQATGWCYIGSSLDIDRRYSEHRRDSGRHTSKKLQEAWNQNQDVFQLVILEEIQEGTESVLLDREQFWLDATLDLYNSNRLAGRPPSRKGCLATSETKEKLSSARIGKQLSKATKRKIGKSNSIALFGKATFC